MRGRSGSPRASCRAASTSSSANRTSRNSGLHWTTTRRSCDCSGLLPGIPPRAPPRVGRPHAASSFPPCPLDVSVGVLTCVCVKEGSLTFRVTPDGRSSRNHRWGARGAQRPAHPSTHNTQYTHPPEYPRRSPHRNTSPHSRPSPLGALPSTPGDPRCARSPGVTPHPSSAPPYVRSFYLSIYAAAAKFLNFLLTTRT